ncbi:T9SS type A sorting domain-containing protein [candidate division KSB1 bacterium]|nr:T9SS type A sorting domain-containing protein [candidate division KSB1 bacterium]
MMFTKNCCLSVVFILGMLNHGLFAAIVLQGVITDNGAEPVENALVELTDQEDTTRVFSDYTDQNGYYQIRVKETGIDAFDPGPPGDYRLYQNHPNPFNPSTVIGYELAKPASIRIEIFNVLGQKIKTLVDGFQSGLTGRVIWDATDDRGQGVPAGLYLYALVTKDARITKKMLLIDGGAGIAKALSPAVRTDMADPIVLKKSMSTRYLFKVSGKDIESYEQNLTLDNDRVLNISVIRTVTDVDGHIYRTVKIGDQWWMAENLKVTHYRNGDPIPRITDNADWIAVTTGAYCNYDNDKANVTTYGRLYNWYAVDDERGIAPDGWHVPTDAEWKQLERFLGLSRSEANDEGWRGSIGGGKLKQAEILYWKSPNTGATNESGFSALPGGYRLSVYGKFSSMGNYAYFWTASASDNDGAWSRSLNTHSSGIGRSYGSEHYGFSVRCVKDE